MIKQAERREPRRAPQAFRVYFRHFLANRRRMLAASAGTRCSPIARATERRLATGSTGVSKIVVN
jgi:hypothetical protein